MCVENVCWWDVMELVDCGCFDLALEDDVVVEDLCDDELEYIESDFRICS